MAQETQNENHTSLPFRRSIPLNEFNEVVVWHDKAFLNTRFELSTMIKQDDDGKKHFRVLASFSSVNEFTKYLASKEFIERF